MTTQRDPHFDLSGGIQVATTWQLRKPNEVEDAINGRFNETIGSIVRRLGYVTEGSSLQAGKPSLGLHESKFLAGARLISAINDSGDTETKLKIYDNSGGSWSNMSLPSTLDPGTFVCFADSLNETYVAGKSSTGDRISILNIKDASTVSATRNLIGAPKASRIVEYGGSLYAMDVELDGVVYSDRAYKSSQALGVITFTQGDQDVFDSFLVDSVRYLKAGMAIDIYGAGTITKTFDITITSVNKAENTVAYSGTTATTFATGDVNTGTDVITIGRDLATGTPVKITSSTTVPAGLTSGTIYYTIRQSATTTKLATTRSNATAGTAIDITSTGSGTHTITSGVYMPDNSEIWLDGRFDDLSYLWNTDNPTPQKADYIRIPPGVDSDSAITAHAKGNNRLFFFTKNSMYKWDSANLVTVFEDVGCPYPDTIQNIGDWLLWVDAEGLIHARNDATGQEELISRAIKPLLDSIPVANFASASAGRYRNTYKLCLGTVGSTVLRLCYDFDTNTWEHDEYPISMTAHVRSDMDGQLRLYFIGGDGQLYLDEEGTTDNGATIPFTVKLGRNNQSTEQLKNYHGVYIYARNMTGASVKVSLDGATDSPTVGKIKQEVTKVAISGTRQYSGRDINLILSINTEGESPAVDGAVFYYNYTEDKFGQQT